MQLDVEELSPIKKRVVVSVPVPRVDSSFSSAYNQISRRVSLPGFRRGRIPMSHLRKRYGQQAAADVSQGFIEQAWRQALDDLKLHPVGEPDIEADLPQQGKPYDFSITFEVAPDIDLAPFDALAVEKVEWTVPDPVVDHELEHLAEEVAPWEPVADRDVAADGDMVVLDYKGTLDGEAFPGGSAEDAEIELGKGQLIPGFEEQIVGQKVGADFVVEVTFPADYPAEHLAGEKAEFACTLKDLKARKVPEPGPELAALLGEESMDEVRAGVRERIEKRHGEQSRTEAHAALRRAVAAQYDFDVPESLVNAGVAEKRNDLLTSAMQGGVPYEEALRSLEADDEAMRAEVTDDVRAELVLDTVGDNEDIDVSPEEVAEYIDRMVRMMGQYGMRLRQAYRDPNRLAGLRRRMRQDKVLDFLLTKANVTSIEREVPMHDHGDGHDHDDDESIEGASE